MILDLTCFSSRGKDMRYVVYVNHPTNKAIVHDTDCGKYTKRRRDRTINGYWSEIFKNFEEAMNYAKRTGKKNIDTCAFCIK